MLLANHLKIEDIAGMEILERLMGRRHGEPAELGNFAAGGLQPCTGSQNAQNRQLGRRAENVVDLKGGDHKLYLTGVRLT